MASTVAAMMATLVIETVGTQEYQIDRRAFVERFALAYGAGAAAEVEAQLLPTG